MINLQSEFDSKTTQLLAEQESTLEEAKRSLFKELDVLKVKIQSQEGAITDNTSEIILQEEALEGFLSLAKEANNKLSVAENRLAEVNERTEHSLTENKHQSDVKELLQADISELEADNNALHSEITENEALRMKLIEDIQVLETEFQIESADKEKKIQLLDAQILDKVSRSDEITRNEYTTRSDIALQLRNIDEKDRNLRIREQKVEMGEAKLIQNSNLLNL